MESVLRSMKSKCRCRKKTPIMVIGNMTYKVCLRCGQLWARDNADHQHYRHTAKGIRRDISWRMNGGWRNNRYPYRLTSPKHYT